MYKLPKVSELDLVECNCPESQQTAPHTCPYAEEIAGDDRLCTCCEHCERQCAMDI